MNLPLSNLPISKLSRVRRFHPHRPTPAFSWRVVGSSLLTLVLAIALTFPAIAAPDLALLKAAEQHRYTWDEAFPGYRAEVSVNYDGELDQGIVKVYPDYQLDLINIDRPEVETFIRNRLDRELSDRRPVPFNLRHNRDKLERLDGEGDRQIYRETVMGGIVEYVVREETIERIQRSQHDRTLSFNLLATAETPEGYLPIEFTNTLTDDRTGEVLQQEDARNFYEKIGKYYLLTYQALRYDKEGDPVEKPAPQRLLRFNDIQPLSD